MRPATNVKAIGKKIGEPPEKWVGRCHEIALKIHKAGLVPKGSRVVYGMWLGRIAEGNVFTGRPFTHHGWIVLPSGTIYDPTRFVFEGKEPYIFIGENMGEYDVGGNAYRAMNMTPRPQPKGKTFTLTEDQAKAIAGFVPTTKDRRVYLSDCFWLANLSLHILGDEAVEVYKVLMELGLVSMIPIDNKHEVMGD